MEKDKTKSKKDERGKDIFGFVIYKQFKNLSLFNKNSEFYQIAKKLSKKPTTNKRHTYDLTCKNNGGNILRCLNEWTMMDEENRLFESCDVSNYQHFLKAVLPQISHLWLFFKARYSVGEENNLFFCNPMRDNLYLADWDSLIQLRKDGPQRDAINSIDSQWKKEFIQNEVINNQIEKRFSAAKAKIHKKTKKAQQNSQAQTQKQREKDQEKQERKETISHLTNYIKLYKYISRMINAINGYYIENEGYNSDKDSQSSLKRLFGDLMSIFSFFMAFGFNEKDNPGINKLDINPYLWELLTKWLLITFIPKFKDYENELAMSKIVDFNYEFPLTRLTKAGRKEVIRFSRCYSSMEFVLLLHYHINLRYQSVVDEYSRVNVGYKMKSLSKINHKYLFKHGRDYKILWLQKKYDELKDGNEYNNTWYDCCLSFRLNNLLSMYILTNNYFMKHEMKALYLEKPLTLGYTAARLPEYLNSDLRNLFECTYFYYLKNDASLNFIKLLEYDCKWVSNKYKQLKKYDFNEREQCYNELFNEKMELTQNFVSDGALLSMVNDVLKQECDIRKRPTMQIGMTSWFQKDRCFAYCMWSWHCFFPHLY